MKKVMLVFGTRPLIWTPFPFLNPGPYKKLT